MSDKAEPIEDLIFHGNENENVAAFLQKVKRVAFAQGRQRDQEWLVDYVEACLSDKALLWYTKLDERTWSDFNSLRVAMLEHFATPVNIPPAAPAAAPIASILARRPSQSNPRGRISFMRHDGLFPGYCRDVERKVSVGPGLWECSRTSKVSDALIVELCKSSDRSGKSRSLLKIVDSNGKAGDECVGVMRLVPGSGLDIWILCLCDEGVLKPYPRAKALKTPSMPAASKIWELIDDTQELRAVWVNSKDGKNLQYMCSSMGY
ncbi:hypothetical protein FRB96_003413 [Tulasnella sp. 330]|nr:hypothetical protein FRB96_003413 [Tulasnella sp. 330]